MPSIYSGGKRIETDGNFTLSKKAIKEILSLCMKKEEDLEDVKISEVFTEDFLNSNFWSHFHC